VIRGLTKNDDYRKLVRAASARSLGQSNEIEMYMQQLRQQQSSIMVGFKKFLPKHVILKQAQVPPQLGPRSIYFFLPSPTKHICNSRENRENNKRNFVFF